MPPSTNPLNRQHLFGSYIWILSIQYFIVEFLVQRVWGPVPYSYHLNTISDLGATMCGTLPVLGTFVCSPLHSFMNGSFILSGILTILGIALVRSAFPRERMISVSFVLIALGALGSIVVGIFPENENMVFHLSGAFVYFILSNFGLLLLGISMLRIGWHRMAALLTALFGVVGLVALISFPLIPIIGIGMLERIVAYPITIWTILTGLILVLRKKPA